MKKVLFYSAFATSLVLASASFAQDSAAKPAASDASAAAAVTLGDDKFIPTTEAEKISYVIGAQIGSNLHQGKVEIDFPTFEKGFKAALKGDKLAMTDEEMNKAMEEFGKKMQEKMMAERNAETGKNLEAANAYLAENGKKEGVVSLPSGLQYKIITAGTGPKPKATDTVKVHYTGTFPDGKKFDSSVDRGEPAEFPVNQVIAGWTEALQLMPVGSKWQLTIPPNLAYGENGRPSIPPNSLLLFDVELISISTPAAAEGSAPASDAPASNAAGKN